MDQPAAVCKCMTHFWLMCDKADLGKKMRLYDLSAAGDTRLLFARRSPQISTCWVAQSERSILVQGLHAAYRVAR